MSDVSNLPGPVSAPKPRVRGLFNRLAMSRGFQRWASRFPLTRGHARREGEALFDILAGFVHTQTLLALVELDILDTLADGPRPIAQLAHRTGVEADRLRVLLRAGASLGMIRFKRGDRAALTVRGATLLGVPGLEGMIQHHKVLYRDLQDPATFLREAPETGLQRFWPYVFGAGAAEDPEQGAAYSNLMTDTQTLVAEETLAALDLSTGTRLMDIGGGHGAFVSAVGAAHPDLRLRLFDLPAVLEGARRRPALQTLRDRLQLTPGDFRADPFPTDADTISLIRVLYDHNDETVQTLLKKVFDHLPDGGRIVVSEPMLSDTKPYAPTDAYFAFYTLAMGTGQTRSPNRIAELLRAAGFSNVQKPRTKRRFITSVVTGIRQ